MLLAYAVLGLIASAPCHGYQLRCQLVDEFGAAWAIDPGQLYRLLARLERSGWVESRAEAGDGGPRRKVYRATTQGRGAVRRWAQSAEGRPERGRDPARVRRFVAGAEAPLSLIGSDDPLLADLVARCDATTGGPRCCHSVAGSMGGLLALRDGRADVAGIHLLDADSGTYNLPFVRWMLPEQPTVLVHLARREQGLFLAPGNPMRVRSVHDLVRKRLRYVNRQRDAGTRLFVWHRLRAAGVDARAITGYGREFSTHDDVAAAIVRGDADVGPGVRAVAARRGLDFVPLGEESFDLAIPQSQWKSPRIQAFVAMLHDSDFRRRAAMLPGYDATRCGEVIARTE